jgi:hypothetical protein
MATRINDLSLAGAFIDSITCYAPGTILRLRFHVQDVSIETAAEIRYTMPQMGMGVRFIDLEPDHLAALENLIDGKPIVRPSAHSDRSEASEGAPAGQSRSDMLLGNFAVVSMFDVIQIIENNRLSGALSVTSPSGIGEVQFNEGRIVGAHSDSLAGLEALKGFLDVTEGSFEFRISAAHYPFTIQAPSNMSLMLDLLRVTDEEAATPS